MSTYEELVETSCLYLRARQAVLVSTYGIGGEYDRVDFSQQSGDLTFFRGEVATLFAQIQVVGTLSTRSCLWTWSWANPTIFDPLKKDVVANVKQMGEQKHYQELITGQWPARGEDAWAMTALTCFLLRAEGAYRYPLNTGDQVFMALTQLSWNQKNILFTSS